MNVEKIRQRIERRYDERLTALENRRTTLLQKLRDGLPDFTNEFPDVTKLIVFGSFGSSRLFHRDFGCGYRRDEFAKPALLGRAVVAGEMLGV